MTLFISDVGVKSSVANNCSIPPPSSRGGVWGGVRNIREIGI